MSRINNDIGEIQRVAAEATGLGRKHVVSGRMPSPCWRGWTCGCSSRPSRLRRSVSGPRHTLPQGLEEVRSRCCAQRSADSNSFLIETIQAMRLVVTNAQDREGGAQQERRAHRRVDVDAVP